MNRCKDCEHFKSDCEFSKIDNPVNLEESLLACGQFKQKVDITKDCIDEEKINNETEI